MGAVVFVEHLDRKGRVIERTRIDSFPAAIGRAYTNAVIIDDRFVSPEHIRLSVSEEGSVVVEDAGSVNGAYFAFSNEKFLKTVLSGEAVVRIGSSVLRLRDQAYMVEEALPLKTSAGSLFRHLTRPVPASAALVAACGVIGTAGYLGNYAPLETPQVVGSVVVLCFLLSLWAGSWSFVNRIVAHSFRFFAHLALAAVGLAAFELSDTFFEYWAFMAPGFYRDPLPFAGVAAVLWCLLYGHLSIFSAATARRRLISTLVVAALVAGGIGSLSFMAQDKRDTPIGFSPVLKPVSTRLLRTHSAPAFFSGLKGVKEKADELAREP